MSITPLTWINQINASGYRLTTPRRMIAEIIAGSDRALTPAEIFIQARSINNGIGLVTVYRTLEKLESLNLVEKVHHKAGCHAYIAHRDGHQHLLICKGCNRVVYFDGDDYAKLMESIGEKSGFQMQDHWLQLLGICPECQKKVTPRTRNDP
jgi:Fur family transcriptional regulator, ferric uptake regulator